MRAYRVVVALVLLLVTAGAVLSQQTDAEIRTEILRRIGTVPGVTIQVQGGLVTMTGNVPTLAQRLNIVNMARRTVGVRSIVDRMNVVPVQRRPDDVLAAAVRQSLASNLSTTERNAITVNVQNSIVTLTGTLPSSYPRQLAGTLSSLVPGVIDVRNQINVRPPQTRTDANILADVNTRYERNPLIPQARINVTVANRVVALTGTVNSFVQAEQAETVARFTPGVVDVTNNLFVSSGG